jgi:UDP-N-acetylmuramoylalanine--D-glutamate ligase
MTAMTERRPAIDPETLTMEAIDGGALRDRPVTVLGFARSGIALARFLHDAGARVTVYDRRPGDELAAAIEALEGRSVTLALGPDVVPATTWADAALVTTSPSVSPDFPTTEPGLRSDLRSLVAARAAGDATAPAIVSEVDLFLRLCPAPVVGVTGTKGKTTTASLTHAILAADRRHRAVLGGNIGTPLVERLPEIGAQDRIVLELSELQLPTLSRGTAVAVYTNVTADHLDRHGSLDAYRRVKRRLAELVEPTGALVVNADDPVQAAYPSLTRAGVVRYRLAPPSRDGLGVDEGTLGVEDGWIVADRVARLPEAAGGDTVDPVSERILPVAEIAIPGRHNLANTLAAVSVGLLFGVSPAAIRAAVAAFRGVEHRLEEVAVIDRVRFVNDSQGTQPDAVIAALEAFPPPIVLIAGGRDKGVDLSALGSVVARRVAATVLIGESAAALERLFRDAGLGSVERAATLEEAVDRADALARSALATASGTATVLLSPAAASFDMFEDYGARGRAFKDAVAALGGRRNDVAAGQETER